MEENVGGGGGGCKHVGDAEGPVDDGGWGWEGLKVEGGYDAEGVGGASESIVDVWECGRGGMDVAPVGQHDIETNNGVQREPPSTGAVAVASVSGMSAHTHTWAGSVGKSSLSLVVDAFGKIAQSHSSADFCEVIGVETDGLKVLEVNDHTSALSTKTERRISVPASSGLHLHIVLRSTGHGIRDMLSGLGENDDGWGVREAEIVGLGQLGEVRGGCQTDGDILLGQTVTKRASSGSGGWGSRLGHCRRGRGRTGARAEVRLAARAAVSRCRATVIVSDAGPEIQYGVTNHTTSHCCYSSYRKLNLDRCNLWCLRRSRQGKRWHVCQADQQVRRR